MMMMMMIRLVKKIKKAPAPTPPPINRPSNLYVHRVVAEKTLERRGTVSSYQVLSYCSEVEFRPVRSLFSSLLPLLPVTAHV